MADKKMKKPSINWKIAADRMAIGEQVELKSLEGFWVRPRRFTKAGEAEILAAQTRAIAKSKSIAASLMDSMPEPETDSERMFGPSAEAKKEIAMSVMENATADMVGRVEENTLRLMHGIEGHNFDESGKATREWAESVMEYSDIANEILAIVAEQNLPLSVRTSRKSAMSLMQSTTEVPSMETPTKDS